MRALTLLLAVACAACNVRRTSDAPPAMPDHVHHDIDYIEITVTDMAAARAFYAAAFGWTFNDYGPEYSGIVRGDGEMGGLALADAPRTGGPLVILFSRDLDASVASVEAAGGTISTPPFELIVRIRICSSPEVGEVARCQARVMTQPLLMLAQAIAGSWSQLNGLISAE